MTASQIAEQAVLQSSSNTVNLALIQKIKSMGSAKRDALATHGKTVQSSSSAFNSDSLDMRAFDRTAAGSNLDKSGGPGASGPSQSYAKLGS